MPQRERARAESNRLNFVSNSVCMLYVGQTLTASSLPLVVTARGASTTSSDDGYNEPILSIKFPLCGLPVRDIIISDLADMAHSIFAVFHEFWMLKIKSRQSNLLLKPIFCKILGQFLEELRRNVLRRTVFFVFEGTEYACKKKLAPFKLGDALTAGAGVQRRPYEP